MSVRPRRRAELRIRAPFEGDFRAVLIAESLGDEQRLVEWLANSGVLLDLADYVVDLREELIVLRDEGRS